MRLYNGDCIDVLEKEVKDNSIDLVVTSPPYDNLRDYGGFEWNEEIWKSALEELYRVLKKGGVCVWIVGDATIKGSETGTSFKQALYWKELGGNIHDTMIWEKTGMQRIDLMTICENDESVFIKIIELKQTGPYVEIINEQLRWYVEWCIDYVVPNYSSKNVVIQPIILAKKMEVEEELKNECETFGRVNENLKVENVLYVGFEVKSENINFERVF